MLFGRTGNCILATTPTGTREFAKVMAIYYRQTTDGSDQIPDNLLAGMLRCLHGQNLDFQHLYPYVAKWLLEVEEGHVIREIGIDKNEAAIVLGPLGRNRGLWPNLTVGFGERDGLPVDKEIFEEHWEQVYRKLAPHAKPKPDEPIREVKTNADL